MVYHILIVEDDDKIADILQSYIKKYNYEVSRASDYSNVKGEFLEVKPDLVLVDINLPQYDGFYWCRQIRTLSNVPILFISARVSEMDQVMAIENGGDDYITKPFSLDVVMAKIKSALRRAYGEYAGMPGAQNSLVDLGGLYLDRSKYTIVYQNQQTKLSQKEFLLLNCLVEKRERIVSREELLEILWDDTHFIDDNTLTVNVTRVRKKLEEIGITDAIETVRGYGYRLTLSWRQLN